MPRFCDLKVLLTECLEMTLPFVKFDYLFYFQAIIVKIHTLQEGIHKFSVFYERNHYL